MGTRCADHAIPLYPQKLALTSPTGGGRSVGIVRSRTKATEFIDGTIYPPQHFPFGAAFLCQAGNFRTLIRMRVCMCLHVRVCVRKYLHSIYVDMCVRMHLPKCACNYECSSIRTPRDGR